MNEEVLIRYLDKWMTIRNSLELGLRGRVRWGGLGVRWGLGAFVAALKVDSHLFSLEQFFDIFGRFWLPNGSIFEGFWVARSKRPTCVSTAPWRAKRMSRLQQTLDKLSKNVFEKR